jgi:lipopolysaccharide export system protein LptA
MNLRNTIATLLLLFGISVLVPRVAFSQVSGTTETKGGNIRLIHAERLDFADPINPDAQRLRGNVRFKHNDAIMFCDSAWLFGATNSMHAFGNVHIKQADSLDIYADTLYYDGNTQDAKLRGNIRMRDGTITLFTDHMDYKMESSIGNYTGGGKIIMRENQNVLTSNEGYYLSDSKALVFRDSVVLDNPQYRVESDTMRYNTETEVVYFFGPTTIVSDSSNIYCENGWYDTKNDLSQFNKNAKIVTPEQTLEGDSLFYDRTTGIGEVFGNIVMNDTVQDIIMTGSYAYYDEKTEMSMITGNAVMTQVFDVDSLFLHADTLYSSQDSAGKKLIKAYYHVKFFRSDLQGKCDSLVYSEADSTFKMFNDPVLWSEDNQLTGDYVEMRTYNGKIEQLTLLNSAFIISEQDSASYNQIKGKKMTGYFAGNSLQKILVEGNGQTVYYAVEDTETPSVDNDTIMIAGTKKIGVNDAICSDILIFVDTASNAINRISFLDQPTATMYPMNKLPEKAMILDGFKWQVIQRPLERKDIFIWTEESAVAPDEKEVEEEGNE